MRADFTKIREDVAIKKKELEKQTIENYFIKINLDTSQELKRTKRRSDTTLAKTHEVRITTSL